MYLYIKYLAAIIIFLSFVSCKCPTEIDTPRVIEPDNSANVIFMNASDKTVGIFSGTIEVIESASPGKQTGLTPVIAGVEIIEFIDKKTGDILAASAAHLAKDAEYICILCNSGRYFTQKILDITDSDFSGTGIRAVNTIDKLYVLKISESVESAELSFAECTDYIDIKPGTYNLRLCSDGYEIVNREIKISKGERLTFVIQNTSGKTELTLIETED